MVRRRWHNEDPKFGLGFDNLQIWSREFQRYLLYCFGHRKRDEGLGIGFNLWMIIKRFFENINVRLKKNVDIWWDLGVVGSLGLSIPRIERDFSHYSSYLNCYIVTMFRKIMKFRQRQGIKDWVVISRSSRWYSNQANLESEIKCENLIQTTLSQFLCLEVWLHLRMKRNYMCWDVGINSIILSPNQ